MAGTPTRSETNAVGNSKFTDLNMTFYPTQIDSKIAGNAGFNPNMKGFWSLGDLNIPPGTDPDFNYAEHVNALADAVMSIQRILGINPQIDYKAVDKGTVSARISAAENKDGYYDKRYGGQNWTAALGQTILTHTHGGGTNEAPQIDLVTDIKGVLKKVNMDISQTTGITGSDLVMSSSVSTKISDAINDKLSVTNGGTIQKDLTVNGQLSYRTYREWTAEDTINGSQISDTTTLINKARRFTGTTSQTILSLNVPNLLCGRYVLGVRLKTSAQLSEAIARLTWKEKSGTTWVTQSDIFVSGTDFDAVNKWQMFYMVFDHETQDTAGVNLLTIAKDSTASSVNLDFDCAWIMPIHPAVFDK